MSADPGPESSVTGGDERRAEIEAYRRANERLEAALLHVINRVSTEGRDDEHKHLFLVGSQAVKHARAEVADTPPSRDGTWAERFRRAADEAERCGPGEGVDPRIHAAMVDAYRTQADQLSPPSPEYMTEADAHRWVDEHVDPPAARHLAHSLVSSLPRVAPAPSRDGSVAVEDAIRVARAAITNHDGNWDENELADVVTGALRAFSPASTSDQEKRRDD